MKKIHIVFLILLVLIAIVVYKSNSTNDYAGVACTEEAKICPDGSAVGRIGPNCEFAPCPQ